MKRETQLLLQPLKLSVITPCLNEREHIDRFLTSIFRQTCQPTEVLVVDGGSLDGTVERVKQWQKRHPNIQLVCEHLRNPGKQRNLGAQSAQCDILLFLDTDTHFADNPYLFERLLIHYRKPHVSSVYGVTAQYGCQSAAKLTYAVYNAIRLILNRMPFPAKRYLTSSSFISIRQDVFNTVGGFASYNLIAEDGVFGESLCRYAKKTGCHCVLDRELRIWHRPYAFKKGWLKAIQYYLYILPYIFHFLRRPFHNITLQSEREFRTRTSIKTWNREIKKYYQAGEFYDWVSSPKNLERIFHGMRERTITNILGSYCRNSTVLDVGCGTGLITRHLRGSLTIGLDINRWNLERLKMRSKSVDVIVGDADYLPIREGSIDTIICTDVIEHLPNPTNVIESFVSALKSEGTVIGSVPSKNPVWKFRRILSHTCPASEPFHRNYSKHEIQRLLLQLKTIKVFRAVFGMTVLFVAQKSMEKYADLESPAGSGRCRRLQRASP